MRATHAEVLRDAKEVLAPGYYLAAERFGDNPYVASHITLAQHCLALLEEIKGYRRALVEHHEEGFLDCPVCRRARDTNGVKV